jgi:hypothetical protein
MVAPTIRVGNTKPSRPISLVQIPRDAKPGYYNLNTVVAAERTGNCGPGASVIRAGR